LSDKKKTVKLLLLLLTGGFEPLGESPGVLPLPSEGDFSMQRYIHEENILLYRKLLADTADEEKRKIILQFKIILQLLAQEEAKELPTPCPEKKRAVF
jgi:hypothetical protein